MKRVVPVVVLILTAAALGVALAFVAHFTLPRIEENRSAAEQRETNELMALVEAMSQTQAKLPPSTDRCKLGGSVETVITRGYGGEMRLVVALWDGNVLAVRVASHHETPGYADALEPHDWIGSFGDAALNDIDAVSRATITTNAVLDAVNGLVAIHEERRLACLRSL